MTCPLRRLYQENGLGMRCIYMDSMTAPQELPFRKADIQLRRGGTSAGIGGREICGRTVGIIGLGRIGLMTAKLFLAFGARVIAYGRSRSEEAEKMGITYCSLEEVLAESDIVSLHLPLNGETRGFLNADRIALMKRDAVFINCARGPIVDNRHWPTH